MHTVPEEGLEPSWAFAQQILRLPRLADCVTPARVHILGLASSFTASCASLGFAITTCRSFHAASLPVLSDSTAAPASRAIRAGAAMSHGDSAECTKRSNRPIAT